MTEEKRNFLKRTTKIKFLAEEANITPHYLSLIINNKRSCSITIAKALAKAVNKQQCLIEFSALDFMENN